MAPNQFVVPVAEGIDATATCTRVKNKKVFRAEYAEAERQGRAEWRDMTEPKRAALVSLLRETLQTLSEDVESWLPETLIAESDQTIGLALLLRTGSIDVQILRQQEMAADEQRHQIADLERITTGANSATA